MVLAILRFKQTYKDRTKEGKYVFEIGWLVDTNNCPDAKKPRDIPCVTKVRTEDHRYDAKALNKILRVKDLAYQDLDRRRRADFRFSLFNMFLYDKSPGDYATLSLRKDVEDYRRKYGLVPMVDFDKGKLTPTTSRKRTDPTEDKKKSKKSKKTHEATTVGTITQGVVDKSPKTNQDNEDSKADDPTEEENKYLDLAAIYKEDTNCNAPPLRGWSLVAMSVQDWFDRIRKHNEKSDLARWLRNTPPDRLGEIMRDGVDLMKIKKNLSSCDDPIEDFEEYEKDLLTQQKEEKRQRRIMKMNRIVKGSGLIHILLQCEVTDEAINVLQEMGLTADETFVTLPDKIEEFKKKVTFRKVDHLIAAARWMKQNSNIPSTNYDASFTDEVMTIQLKALQDQRAAEKAEKQQKEKEQLIHILCLCGMNKDNAMDSLRRSNVASLNELLKLDRQIKGFKNHLGHMRRSWYKDYEMPKDVQMSNVQLGNGWFEDTVTDKLYVCCRLLKDNPNTDFYENLTSGKIDSAMKTDTELNTYNAEKKFKYMVHLCELTNNMDALKACNITRFDDLLQVSNTWNEFEKKVTTKQLDRHVIDKLFVCTRLVRTNITRDIFTAATKDKFAEELRLLNSKRSLQQATATQSTMRCDAVALGQNLKHMLDSKEIPDNVRKTLRDTLSVFLKKFHRDYEKLKEDFTLVKNQICDESSNKPTESIKSVDTTLSGFHVQIKTLQDILGLHCIPKKIIAPSVKAGSLRKFLNKINVELETESQINNISNIMKWPDNAVEFITKNKMQEAVIIFNPGRFDSIRNFYFGKDDNTASEYDMRIVEEIKMLEQNNMWISSLKANPDGDYPGFIAVV